MHEWNSELYELDVGIPLRNATDSQGESTSRCPKNQLAKYLVEANDVSVHLSLSPCFTSGVCEEIEPGVFHRPWSKVNVTLDCNAGEAGWVAHIDKVG